MDNNYRIPELASEPVMSLLRPFRLYTERRLGRRFPVDIVARIETQQVKMSAQVLDISKEGLRLMLPDYVKPDVFFTLHLQLPGQDEALELTARIVSCRLIPRERKFMAGCRLTGASASRAPELQGLLSRLAAEHNS